MEEDILNVKAEDVAEEIEGDDTEEKEEVGDTLGDFYYINETYRIDRDSRQYFLQKKQQSDKEGSKEHWVNVGYFPELKWLYHHLVELRIRETSLNDLKAFCAEIQKLHDEINKKYP
jgi:hypothetical protein